MWKELMLKKKKHTVIFKMDNQQGPTVEHVELCTVAAWMGASLGDNRDTYIMCG